MLKMKYIGDAITHEVTFTPVSAHVVQLAGDIPQSTQGFDLYRPDDMLIGSYADYTTVYREIDGAVQYSNDGSIYVEPIPPEPTQPPEPYVPTLEELQAAKRTEVSAACERIIYSGVDVQLSGGAEHFSLTEHDQLNLFGKQAQIVAGAAQLEYHADGQPCRYYSVADITAIITEATFHVSYHTTYCNAINMWIAGCQTADEVQTIFYGADVPEAYQSDVLKAYLAQIMQEAADVQAGQ